MGRKLTILRNVLILVLVIFLSALSITLWQNYPESAAPAAILGRTLHLASYISSVLSIASSVLSLVFVILLSSIRRYRNRKVSIVEGEGHKNPDTRSQFIRAILKIIFLAFPHATIQRAPGTPIVEGGIRVFLVVSAYTVGGFLLILTSFAVHIGIYVLLVKAIRRNIEKRKQEDEEALIEWADAGEKGSEANEKSDGINKEIDGGKTDTETPAPHTAATTVLVEVDSDNEKGEALKADVGKTVCGKQVALNTSSPPFSISMDRKLTILRNILILVLIIFLSALFTTLWQNYPKSAALGEILKQTLHLACYFSAVASIVFSAVKHFMLRAALLRPQSPTTEGEGRKKPITRKQVMNTFLFTIFIAFPSAILLREPGTPMVAGGILMYIIISSYTTIGLVLILTSVAVHVGIFICLVKATRRKRRRMQEDEEALIESRANAGVKGLEENQKPDMNKEIDGGKTNAETPAPPAVATTVLVEVDPNDEKDEALKADIEKTDGVATEQILQ